MMMVWEKDIKKPVDNSEMNQMQIQGGSDDKRRTHPFKLKKKHILDI